MDRQCNAMRHAGAAPARKVRERAWAGPRPGSRRWTRAGLASARDAGESAASRRRTLSPVLARGGFVPCALDRDSSPSSRSPLASTGIGRACARSPPRGGPPREALGVRVRQAGPRGEHRGSRPRPAGRAEDRPGDSGAPRRHGHRDCIHRTHVAGYWIPAPQRVVASALDLLWPAALTDTGEIVAGCNTEDAARSPAVCTERVALFSAPTQGKGDGAATSWSRCARRCRARSDRRTWGLTPPRVSPPARRS